MVQIHLHDYTNFLSTVQTLRNFETSSLGTEVQIFIGSYTFEMVMYLDTGNFKKGVEIVDAILNGLDKYKDKITIVERITMIYNIAYLYFGCNNYKESLKYINMLLNDYKANLRFDIHSAAKIFNLILHYELNNFEHLDYIIKSTTRFLDKTNRRYELEMILVRFLRKNIYKIHSATDRIEVFSKLKEECEKLLEDEFERKAFDYFDYISWMNSKIEDKPFAQVVQEKPRFSI